MIYGKEVYGPLMGHPIGTSMTQEYADNHYGNRTTGDYARTIHGDLSNRREIPVNKTTHRIRFEHESESSVVIVIERKEQD